MNRKIITVLVLLLGFCNKISSQQIEKLTFTDMRPDGTIIGTVTVNAAFFCNIQSRISIENGMMVTQESWYYNGEWTPWQLLSREPSRVHTIRQAYDQMLQHYNNYPRSSVRVNVQGMQGVKIMTIPNGRSSPLWWSDDGRSFNLLTQFWILAP